MAGEPEKPENGAEWSMPEPVFRSSDGHDLRAEPTIGNNIVGSEDTTEIPEFKMENQSKDTKNATGPEIENAVETEVRGDKLGMSMTLVGLIALLGAAVIFLLIYFLFFKDAVPAGQ